MAGTKPTIMRRSKDDGTTHLVSREFALERLDGCYDHPVTALDSATEQSPAQTPFAVYWPVEVGR